MANVSSSNGLEKRPKLRFPGFDEPWRAVHLFDVVNLRRERARSSKEVYVSTENLLQNFEGLAPYQNDDEVEGVAYYTGDSLLANIRPYLKKAWYATFDGTCSADVLAFSPKKISPTFLYNIIARDCFIEYVMSGVKGSKMPRGDKKHILDYAVAIPEKDEQEKIATFITLADHRIARQRELIATLKKYKRGVVRSLLSPEECELKNAQWSCDTIGNLGSFIKGAPLSKADISKTGTPFILYGELYTTYHEVITSVVRKTEAEVDSVYRSIVGDVLIPTSGETPEEISTASCVMLPGVILAGDLNIFRSSKVDGRIMSYILNHIVNGRIARVAQGKSIVHVQASEISKIEISYPDPETQDRIVRFLEAISSRVEYCEKELDNLIKMRGSLLQQLFI